MFVTKETALKKTTMKPCKSHINCLVLCVMCLLSCVMCPVSHVTCHVAGVIYEVSTKKNYYLKKNVYGQIGGVSADLLFFLIKLGSSNILVLGTFKFWLPG